MWQLVYRLTQLVANNSGVPLMTARFCILNCRSLGYGTLAEHFHGSRWFRHLLHEQERCQVMSTSTVFLMLNVLWTR